MPESHVVLNVVCWLIWDEVYFSAQCCRDRSGCRWFIAVSVMSVLYFLLTRDCICLEVNV